MTRTGRENRPLLPLTSDPTFCPRDARHKSRSETNGGLWSDRCSFSLSPIHSKKRFTRSIIPTAEFARQLRTDTQQDQLVYAHISRRVRLMCMAVSRRGHERSQGRA
jgi:hypothetical protein